MLEQQWVQSYTWMSHAKSDNIDQLVSDWVKYLIKAKKKVVSFQ